MTLLIEAEDRLAPINFEIVCDPIGSPEIKNESTICLKTVLDLSSRVFIPAAAMDSK
tara:strand:- start:79 stop:249 length:171 start_codon:yes stop_codon:yes gene_type:complete